MLSYMAVVHKNGSPLFYHGLRLFLYWGTYSMIVFLILTMFLGGHARNDFIIWIFLTFMGLVITINRSGIYFSGAYGEHKALSKLKKELSDDFHIYVNVKVHEKMESDMVIVGPTGVFDVEVKNYNGTLEGGRDDKEWILHKTGQKGGTYSKTIRNPINQLKRNVFILAKFLKIEGSNVWVDGAILFPNGHTAWRSPNLNLAECYTSAQAVARDIKKTVPRWTISQDQLNKIHASLEKCINGQGITKKDFDALTLDKTKIR